MSPPLSGLFVDSDFAAKVSSLVHGGDTQLALLSDNISWQRPLDICASPSLFSEKNRLNLGKQGILGDCWFICACTALQKYDRLLGQVFPDGQCTWTDPNYLGQFICRFWRFGRWVEVTIDDNLPCLGNKLCFSHCQDQGAFWLPLLEKAYAKLHGCYEALWAGQVADALVDLTGGLVERWFLGSEDESGREKLFSKLVSLKDRCAMCCSVLHNRERVVELGEPHAYTITDIQHVVTKGCKDLLLLRLHNPWGRSSWAGSWCTGGDGWNDLDPKDSTQLLSGVQEGEFWVEKQEFLQEFDEVTIAFPCSHEGHLQSIWTDSLLLYKQQIYGSWVKGHSAGGSRNNITFSENPKFWLRVKEPSEVFLSLMQIPHGGVEIPEPVHGVYRRNLRLNRTAFNAVGFHVWKVEKRRFKLQKTLSSLPLAGTSSHCYDRQLHLSCNLSPGYHLLIPSIFLREAEGNFLLHILSTGNITLSECAPSCDMSSASADLTCGMWETQELRGQWKKGSNAGGSRNFDSYTINPCFPFSVPDGAPQIRLTLRQQHSGEKCHAIGFHVYSVTSNESVISNSLEPCVKCIPHSHCQEVSKLCVLPPGQYTLVPSTYLPDQESNFTVTIATKIERKPIQSLETLGKVLQECTYPRQLLPILADIPHALKASYSELQYDKMLRENIESRLKLSLPHDLGAALMDDVVLCHLANHVRPRSVPSIHVPSPAVPKLSMAKCRRNVENFLEACRKIGVPQDKVCLPSDILQLNLCSIKGTLECLLSFGECSQTPAISLHLLGFVVFYCTLMLLLFLLYRWVLNFWTQA